MLLRACLLRREIHHLCKQRRCLRSERGKEMQMAGVVVWKLKVQREFVCPTLRALAWLRGDEGSTSTMQGAVAFNFDNHAVKLVYFS